MSIYIFPIGSVLWWTLTHLQFSILSYTNGKKKNRNLLTMHWTWVEHFLNKALLGSFDLYRRDSYSKNMLRKIFCTLVICAHVLLWYGFSSMISVVSFFLGIYLSFEYVKFKIRIRIEIKGLLGTSHTLPVAKVLVNDKQELMWKECKHISENHLFDFCWQE